MQCPITLQSGKPRCSKNITRYPVCATLARQEGVSMWALYTCGEVFNEKTGVGLRKGACWFKGYTIGIGKAL